MKKAFTLIEMLIVVVVLVTLMSITFRLSSISEGQSARSVTIERLQRVENCISGYMAAYGTYPPVPLHASRNIYLSVNQKTGVQTTAELENPNIFGWSEIGSAAEEESWLQVRAACEAQPIGCYYPYGQDYQDIVKQGSTKAGEGDHTYLTKQQRDALKSGYTCPLPGAFASSEAVDWREVQIFQFGLLSFLLPRYLVMLDADAATLSGLVLTPQWTANNSLPFDPYAGTRFTQWSGVYDLIRSGRGNWGYSKVANIASQAICARWIANLKNICKCDVSKVFYGIELKEPDCPSPLLGNDVDVRIYNSVGQNYILDGITVCDGWGSQLYYYSPAPYQTYTLWSAGANKRTLPPWVDKRSLDDMAKKCVGKWIADDIVRLSN